MKCEFPDCTNIDAKPIPCMTSYAWDGEGENPNRDPVLCAEGADEYHKHWQDMWYEYYSSQGLYCSRDTTSAGPR